MYIAQGNALGYVRQWGKRPERAKVLQLLGWEVSLLKLCQATTMTAQLILIINCVGLKSDTTIVGRISAGVGGFSIY